MNTKAYLGGSKENHALEKLPMLQEWTTHLHVNMPKYWMGNKIYLEWPSNNNFML